MRKLPWGVVAVAVLLAGCAPQSPAAVVSASVVDVLGGEAPQGFARAYAPIAFEFPRDHGAHPEYQTEWWYYTGNLQDVAGREYGFQFTLFRSALTPEAVERSSTYATNQVYMAHFALTDVAAGRHVSFERFSRGAGGLAGAVGEPTFAAWIDDWSVRQETPAVMRLQAAADGEDGRVAIDLALRLTRRAVLQGEEGLSQKGAEPGNASYYYSLVGLETTGTVTSGGEPVAITGLSWMDREFGTSALDAATVGWDWFALQLDNGAALMLYQLRSTAGEKRPQSAGVLVYDDGRQERLGADDFELTPIAQWTSPQTGIIYPAGWLVSLPAQAVELRVEPLVADQEMDVSFVYWEGAAAVSGEMASQPVQGRGYVELTGYGTDGQRSGRQ